MSGVVDVAQALSINALTTSSRRLAPFDNIMLYHPLNDYSFFISLYGQFGGCALGELGGSLFGLVRVYGLLNGFLAGCVLCQQPRILTPPLNTPTARKADSERHGGDNSGYLRHDLSRR